MRNNLIYDIGGHFGLDSTFYLLKGFKVIAIEANPYCCEEMKKILSHFIKIGQLELIEKAIGKKGEKEVELLIHKKHSDWGTVLPEWNAKYGDEIEKVKVQTINLTEYLWESQIPYYMKIDIEGYDIEVLRQLSLIHPRPKYISVELLTFNNILGKNVNCLELINELLNLGYKKFQIVDQSKNHLTKCPYPAREGEYVNYKFDGYCSGLFGKELPEDKWTDIEEILFKYFHYFYNKPNCCGESIDKNGWFDIHAKLD
jgi:FkbM family methyltransferase